MKCWVLNIKTVSESNSTECWQLKAKRHKSQKRFIRLWGLENNISQTSVPCSIKITRLAPGNGLDEDDNLRVSVKWVKDYIADIILPGQAPGRADGDKRIKWLYDQQRHPIYAIRIEILDKEEDSLSKESGHFDKPTQPLH
jgi:hypothetical protein